MDGNTFSSDGPAMLVPFPFPLKGISETWARHGQPDLTTPDCLNVMPFDLTGRARGGSRPGVVQSGTTKYGGGGTNDAIAQWLGQITVEVGTNSAYVPHYAAGQIQPYIRFATKTQLTAGRAEFLVLVAGGQAYFGTASSSLTLITGSGQKVDRDVLVSAACLDGKMYLVDGSTNICMINFTVDPPVWTTYAASAGTSPASTGPRICCVYRKRLVMGAGLLDSQPENFYASKLGDATDWNYSGPGPDAAWAGNASKGGQPGEPLSALVPLGDDAMVIGCDRSIWIMRGDIADGGRIDVLTRGVGMVSQKAVTFDPTGNMYFVGSNGWYRMLLGSYALEDLSLPLYPSWFQQAALAVSISCVYDKDRHGIWIFRTPIPQGSAPTHLWYDLRMGGFFPQQFPAAVGPLVSWLFEHAGNTMSREMLVAGYANSGGTNKIELNAIAGTASTDLGTAISSYMWIGPIRPAGSMATDSRLIACDFILGDQPASGFTSNSLSLTYWLTAGRSAYEAFSSPRYSAVGSFNTFGRQILQRNRVRGESFMLRLGNTNGSKIWGAEEVLAQCLPGGVVRVGGT